MGGAWVRFRINDVQLLAFGDFLNSIHSHLSPVDSPRPHVFFKTTFSRRMAIHHDDRIYPAQLAATAIGMFTF